MSWNISLEVRAVIIHRPPYTFHSVEQDGKSYFGGPFVTQFFEIMDHLKLKYKTEHQQKNVFGMNTSSGWTGLMGSLQNDTADVALFASPTSDREEVAYFSNMIYFDNNIVLAGSLNMYASPSLLNLALVLDKEVWVLLAVSIVVMLLVSCFQVRIDTTGDKYIEKHEGNPAEHSHSVALTLIHKEDIITLCSCYISALFMEGSYRLPVTTRGRFLFAIWWLSMLVIANGYCGLLRAAMLRPRALKKIDNINDLSKELRTVQPMLNTDDATAEFFKEGRTNEQKEIWRSVQDGNNLLDFNSVMSANTMSKVAEGYAAVILDKITIRYHFPEIPDPYRLENFYIAQEPVLINYVCVAFNRHFDRDIVKKINKRIRMYGEAHILEKEINKELRNKIDFLDPTGQEPIRALAWKDILGLFILYLTCQTFPLVTFLGELLLVSVSCDFFRRIFTKTPSKPE